MTPSLIDNITFGWLPDLPDHRDRKFVPKLTGPLPDRVDLSGRCPPIWSQGNIGSCVAHGAGRAFVVEHMERSRAGFMPSRLQLYYDSRALQGWQKRDSGCYIRDAVKSLAKTGVGEEKLWPYETSRYATKPPQAVYDSAKGHQALEYVRIENTNLYDIKAALAAGNLVIFGITVYQSMMTSAVTRTGAIPMPARTEKVVGGHCMALTGYSGDIFQGHNSWGTGWGRAGAFTIPAAYLTNPDLAADFWSLRKVEV